MAFSIGFLIGIAFATMIICPIGEKIMNDAYMEGFRKGQDEILHRISRRMEDDCK